MNFKVRHTWVPIPALVLWSKLLSLSNSVPLSVNKRKKQEYLPRKIFVACTQTVLHSDWYVETLAIKTSQAETISTHSLLHYLFLELFLKIVLEIFSIFPDAQNTEIKN